MKITFNTLAFSTPANGSISYFVLSLTLLSLACLLSGCGGGAELTKAGGTVTYDGKPVPGGTIKFYPVNGGRSANATIEEDGTFTLSYKKQGDGLPPGDYMVAVVSTIKKGGKTNAEDDVDGESLYDTSGKIINVVPVIYNDVRTSPLRQTVTASGGQQQLEIDIPAKK